MIKLSALCYATSTTANNITNLILSEFVVHIIVMHFLTFIALSKIIFECLVCLHKLYVWFTHLLHIIFLKSFVSFLFLLLFLFSCFLKTMYTRIFLYNKILSLRHIRICSEYNFYFRSKRSSCYKTGYTAI